MLKLMLAVSAVFVMGTAQAQRSGTSPLRTNTAPCPGGQAQATVEVPVGAEFNSYYLSNATLSNSLQQLGESYAAANCDAKRPSSTRRAMNYSCSFKHDVIVPVTAVNETRHLSYKFCQLPVVSSDDANPAM